MVTPNYKISISHHKNGLVSGHQSAGRWFTFYELCSKNILMKLVGYRQPTCFCVKMEFVVGTISLSCELYSLSWSCFCSCGAGTIVYGKWWAPTLSEWPFQEKPGSGITAIAALSDVSAPACTDGEWPSLLPVSVAQKNKPSTMLSLNVQPIELLMECKAWRFWTKRQSNGCTTLARDLVRLSSGWKNWLKRKSASTWIKSRK